MIQKHFITHSYYLTYMNSLTAMGLTFFLE